MRYLNCNLTFIAYLTEHNELFDKKRTRPYCQFLYRSLCRVLCNFVTSAKKIQKCCAVLFFYSGIHQVRVHTIRTRREHTYTSRMIPSHPLLVWINSNYDNNNTIILFHE